jgi:hypothetical protein
VCAAAAAAVGTAVLFHNSIVQPKEHPLPGFEQCYCCDAALVPPLVHNCQREG